MSRTRAERKSKTMKVRREHNGAMGEVFTLAEVAGYLRASEADVLQMVREQALPGRQIGTEWRFLKCAVQAWLAQPFSRDKREGSWASAGSWKDERYLDELLQNIFLGR